MRCIKIIVACLICVLPLSQVQADLELTLTGTAGSSVIEYEATGSVVMTANGPAFNGSSIGRAVVGGSWVSDYDTDLGDFLSNSMDTSLNDDLVLSGGGVIYRRNGSQFHLLDTLDLDGSTSAGGDDVELDPTMSFDYPSFSIGDVISWDGQGTFALEDGETFDTLFTSLGSFSNSIDGGLYTVIIAQTSSVPEPGSCALFCSALAFGFGRRRKIESLNRLL